MNPAFAYVYDDFLSDRRYERDVAALETELARRGIEGRVGRLAMFRSAKEMIVDMATAGVKNIVFVGNDETLQKMMWFLPEVDVTVGFIPLVPSTRIGELLGIPAGIGAVDILAARLIETLDVGKLDDRYFLTEVILPATVAAIEIEGQYRISPSSGGSIAVRNLGSVSGKEAVFADVKDGWLEVVVQSRPEKTGGWFKGDEWQETHLRLQHGRIISAEPTDVFMDGHVVNGFCFTLSIIPKKLKIIAGRRRVGEAGGGAEALSGRLPG